jgi:membrane protein YqaA with SNARE-associated domain
MKKVKLPGWLQKLVSVMGGGGLFVLAFLDSSVLSFPFFTDALMIQLSIVKPSHMPLYAAMAAGGSLCGCIWLYLLAKKGGEAYFRRHASGRGEKIKKWVEDHAFLSVFVAAILPPPFPFKIFVLAEGVFQAPLRTFVLAILLGRGLRYAVEGILAVRYGGDAMRFLTEHSLASGLSVIVVIVVLFLAGRFLFPPSKAQD